MRLLLHILWCTYWKSLFLHGYKLLHITSFLLSTLYTAKKKNSTTEWLPWLQETVDWKKQIGCFNHKSGCPGYNHAEKRVGYERLILVTETNCTKQPERQLLCSSLKPLSHCMIVTTNTWGNHLLALKAWKFLTATLKCICKDSLTDVQRVLSILWCKMDWARLLTC